MIFFFLQNLRAFDENLNGLPVLLSVFLLLVEVDLHNERSGDVECSGPTALAGISLEPGLMSRWYWAGGSVKEAGTSISSPFFSLVNNDEFQWKRLF